MLVSGPPRSGKTSSLVIPSVLDAPGRGGLHLDQARRARGHGLPALALGDVLRLRPDRHRHASPTAPTRCAGRRVVGCEDFEAAVAMAHALGSAARPGSALTESAHWVERAEAPPRAAALRRRAARAGTWRRCVAGCSPGICASPWPPSRPRATRWRCAVLAGVRPTEDRERSGIFSTAAGLLAAYRSEAALATTREPNFDPAAFARSTDALYICAPGHAQEQLAPIVVALLEQIRAAVYARPADAAPVVFALDEVAGIAPLPSLPALAAEGAGQGLVTLACLQDLSQARARWGAEAEGFFSLFNSKVIFPGIGDQRTLSLVSALAGEQVVPVRSRTSVHPLVALISPSALRRRRRPPGRSRGDRGSRSTRSHEGDPARCSASPEAG